jgi:glucosamine--fructose-6-phosphate aminotransferase (isomerizing)
LFAQEKGKVKLLENKIWDQELNFEKEFENHLGIAHTRWATHGEPSPLNAHPHTSDDTNEFVMVHNGIITNYKDIRAYLNMKGYPLITETDTECIVKLLKYIYDKDKEAGKNSSFADLVKETIQELEGAFALVFKSSHFPNECIATRRGSPLLIGV